jgi:hypothetical protein
MVFRRSTYPLFLLFASVALCGAQEVQQEGILLGNIIIRPQTTGLLAYDNRVYENPQTGSEEADVYTDISAGASLANQPARYSISMNANYGQRYYDTYTEQDGNYYNASAAISSQEAALQWGLSASMSKELSYDVAYDPETGTQPGPILSDQSNKGWTFVGNVSYAIPVSEKTSIVPGYSLTHYYREFDNSGSADWDTHDASLIIRHQLSEKTSVLAGGFYTVQTNPDEKGYIVIVGAGGEGKITEKTAWTFLAGVGHVDYDASGSDQSGLLDLKLRWAVTEKVSVYAFYGNSYEPGYDGGSAYMLYRAGYGGEWQFLTRWSLGAQVLHNYSQGIGSGNSDEYGGVEHFFSANVTYRPTNRLSASLSSRYANDEEPDNQEVVSLSLTYMF